jgi:hypothetical protein
MDVDKMKDETNLFVGFGLKFVPGSLEMLALVCCLKRWRERQGSARRYSPIATQETSNFEGGRWQRGETLPREGETDVRSPLAERWNESAVLVRRMQGEREEEERKQGPKGRD